MKEPTLTRYGNILLVEDGEGELSTRDVNKIERDEKQRCIIQVERRHVFADKVVGCLCRAMFFGMFPDWTYYKKGDAMVGYTVAHYDVVRRITYVDFQNTASPSQVIKGTASVLGAHAADTFLKLPREEQENRSVYAAQIWGKSALGEIPFMLAFWEVFASRARG